jgi:hypothetical protein
MAKRETKKKTSESPEQVTAREALKRMKAFEERKEKFVAAIKKSKD